MNRNEYNGWTNYETWLVNLWIDNDEGSQSYWAERAEECVRETDGDKEQAIYELANLLRDEVQEGLPDVSGLYLDLLQSAIGEVDWNEIASNMVANVEIDEVKE